MPALQFATATANLASQNAFLFLATHGPILFNPGLKRRIPGDFGAFTGDGACVDGDRALFRDVASRAD